MAGKNRSMIYPRIKLIYFLNLVTYREENVLLDNYNLSNHGKTVMRK